MNYQINTNLDGIAKKIQEFDPISLEEIDNVKLMNRVDTKFIFNVKRLPEILLKIQESYKILEINSQRLFNYKTTYFDTNNLAMYLAHHNGKFKRYKIRLREYLDSNQVYFEIKQKSNKKRTDKKRRLQNKNSENLLEQNSYFIKKHTPYHPDTLQPKLVDIFSRFTLVHKKDNIRLTCDLALNFDNFKDQIILPYLTIIEAKQDRYFKFSDFKDILNDKNIVQTRISKYCMGITLLNDHIKSNSFKRKILTIHKIESDAN